MSAETNGDKNAVLARQLTLGALTHSIEAGTAAAGEDYVAASGSVTL